MKQFLDNEAKGTKVIGAESLEDMVSKLKTPRKIMLLVKGECLCALPMSVALHALQTHTYTHNFTPRSVFAHDEALIRDVFVCTNVCPGCVSDCVYLHMRAWSQHFSFRMHAANGSELCDCVSVFVFVIV